MPHCTDRAVKSWFLIGCYFVFAHTAIAEDIPKDPAGYTEYVAGQLRAGLADAAIVDTPSTIRLLNAKDLKTLGLSAEEVQQLALLNLRNSLKPLMEVAKVAQHGQIGQLVGDSYQSSRLALFDTWAPLAKAQPWCAMS